MLFTILIYGAEGLADRLPAAEREALLQKHRDLQARLQSEGRFRGAVQLMPPSTAMNVQDKGSGVRVLDGPYAESKEHPGLLPCRMRHHASRARGGQGASAGGGPHGGSSGQLDRRPIGRPVGHEASVM